MDLLGELLRLRDRPSARWRHAGEREEVITREHLCVTNHGVTEPDVDVEPREVSPSHPRHDREHAASARRHLDLAPRRLDDELEEIAKISTGLALTNADFYVA